MRRISNSNMGSKIGSNSVLMFEIRRHCLQGTVNKEPSFQQTNMLLIIATYAFLAILTFSIISSGRSSEVREPVYERDYDAPGY